MNKIERKYAPNADPMHVQFLSSNEIPRATQRKCQHQRRQNASTSLVSCRDRIREDRRFVVRATTGISASVRIADTLSTSVPRVRRFQIPNPEHVGAYGRER